MPVRDLQDQLEAQRYVADQLSRGTTLARVVLRKTTFESGRFRAILPETLDQGRPLDLASGNLRLTGDEEAAFARLVKRFISNSNCALLMQDLEASLSDPWLRDCSYKRLAVPYNSELYWRVTGSRLAQLSDEEMLDVLNSAGYLPWTGFFYLDGVPEANAELRDADLEQVVNSLVGVGVGAFDFRSFVIWWRDDLLRFPT